MKTFRQFLEGWGAPDVTDFRHGYSVTSHNGKYTVAQNKKQIHDHKIHSHLDALHLMKTHAAKQGLDV